MLTNGGFETGSLPPWIRTTPNGACTGQSGSTMSSAGDLTGAEARTGSCYLTDGSISCADQISQSFTVTRSRTYNITFWLKSSNKTTPGDISAKVTIG